MARRQRQIRVRAGQFEFVKLNAEKFDWRDTYHLILTLSWPGFAGFVFGIYLLINLVFAALYMLEAHAVAEMSPGSFSDAFSLACKRWRPLATATCILKLSMGT